LRRPRSQRRRRFPRASVQNCSLWKFRHQAQTLTDRGLSAARVAGWARPAPKIANASGGQTPVRRSARWPTRSHRGGKRKLEHELQPVRSQPIRAPDRKAQSRWAQWFITDKNPINWTVSLILINGKATICSRCGASLFDKGSDVNLRKFGNGSEPRATGRPRSKPGLLFSRRTGPKDLCRDYRR
jgi:hypothetical protein